MFKNVFIFLQISVKLRKIINSNNKNKIIYQAVKGHKYLIVLVQYWQKQKDGNIRLTTVPLKPFCVLPVQLYVCVKLPENSIVCAVNVHCTVSTQYSTVQRPPVFSADYKRSGNFTHTYL